MGRWAARVADEVFSLNAKLPRTLWLLVAQPGELTRAWMEGRRVRYTKPARLFLLTGFVFFTEFFLLGTPAEVPLFQPMLGEVDDFALRAVAEAIQNDLRQGVLVLAALLVPLTAAALKLLYIRRERYLVEHAIHTLHLFAAGFLVATVTYPLPLVGVPGGYAAGGFLLGGLAYLVVSLRQTYGDRWSFAGIRSVALVVGVGVVTLGGLAPFATDIGYQIGYRGGVYERTLGEAADRQYRRWSGEGDPVEKARYRAAALAAHRELDRIYQQAWGVADSLSTKRLYRLGRLQTAAGRDAGSLRALERVLEREPEHLWALGVAGRAAERLGDTARARRYFRRMIEAYSEDATGPFEDYSEPYLGNLHAYAESYLDSP